MTAASVLYGDRQRHSTAVGEFSNHMQVVVKLSVHEGEVMHNICRGGLEGRIFCRVCQFVPFVCGA